MVTLPLDPEETFPEDGEMTQLQPSPTHCHRPWGDPSSGSKREDDQSGYASIVSEHGSDGAKPSCRSGTTTTMDQPNVTKREGRVKWKRTPLPPLKSGQVIKQSILACMFLLILKTSKVSSRGEVHHSILVPPPSFTQWRSCTIRHKVLQDLMWIFTRDTPMVWGVAVINVSGWRTLNIPFTTHPAINQIVYETLITTHWLTFLVPAPPPCHGNVPVEPLTVWGG